jgi:dihydrofolate reductase
MARLIYSAIMSLDGYAADADGRFEWAAPDEEVHAFVNELERPVGTYLYGRRMYETMRYWETAHTLDGQLRDAWPSGPGRHVCEDAVRMVVHFQRGTAGREPAEGVESDDRPASA